MARTPGAIGWKKQQAYLHEKFPEQGWMEEEDREKIKENYKGVKASEDNGVDYPDGPWAKGWDERAGVVN